MRAFRDVLEVDAAAGWVDAEGMASYEDLVRGCLVRGVMPAVVPQLKTITLGGAVAGVGIESSSHRHGLVHDTVHEIEVLLGDGSIVLAAPDNEHADLYYGFPNSYGTLGYALRVKAKVVPVQPYVHLTHEPYADPARLFEALGERLRAGDADFVDGTLFAPRKMFLTLGRFAAKAPHTSDYTFEHIYYRSIAEKREDWLTVHDYLWRWDTDWFWCSKNVLAQQPLVRRFVYGRRRLGSRTYTKVMRWNSRVGLTKKFERLLGLHSGSVIRARRRVLRVLPPGDRPVAAVDLSHRPGAARRALHPLPDGAGVGRELRLLGREAHARSARPGALQPAHRAQSDRAGRHQVAVLGELLSRGRVPPPLRRRGLRRAQAQVRPGRGVPDALRQVRAAALVQVPKPSATMTSIRRGPPAASASRSAGAMSAGSAMRRPGTPIDAASAV